MFGTSTFSDGWFDHRTWESTQIVNGRSSAFRGPFEEIVNGEMKMPSPEEALG